MAHANFFLAFLVLAFSICFPATLCSFYGPDVSDSLELTNFKVSGPVSPSPGDTLTVEFTLRNVGKTEINLGPHGIFTAVRDPEGKNRDTGHTMKSASLKQGQAAQATATIPLNAEGIWSIWPSYEIDLGKGSGYGPAGWNECIVGVKATEPEVEELPDPNLYIAKAQHEPVSLVAGESATVRVYLAADSPAKDVNENVFVLVELDGKKFTELVFERPVKAGRQIWKEFSWKPEKEGTHRFVFTADPDNYIIESNKKDNVKEWKVSVAAAPEPSPEPTAPIMEPGPIEALPLWIPLDTDFDGVPDEEDLCPRTPFRATVDGRGCGCLGLNPGRSRFVQGTILVDPEPVKGLQMSIPRPISASDYCVDATHLAQVRCGEGNTVREEIVECTSGCYAGRCLCGDSDQINFYERGYHMASQAESPPPGAVFFAPAFRPAQVAGIMVNNAFIPLVDMPRGQQVALAGGLALFPGRPSAERIPSHDTFMAPSALSPSGMGFVSEFCIDEHNVLEYYGEVVGEGASAYCAIRNTTHRCEYGCIAGACVPFPSANRKNLSKYPEEGAFMISTGAPWQEILMYNSVAVWQEGMEIDLGGGISHRFLNTHTHPYLIYGRSGRFVDVDSTVHFIQQYSPQMIYFLDSPPPDVTWVLTLDAGTPRELIRANPGSYMGAGMGESQLAYLPPTEYFSFWEEINTFVVCEDDYATGLVCAQVASLLNAPLLFDGHTANWNPVYHKNAIVIGSLSRSTRDRLEATCNIISEYSLGEAQLMYADATGTDKLVLVNPDDRASWAPADFNTVRTPGRYEGLYMMDSLSAPYIASAKKQAIIFIPSKNYEEISRHVEGEFVRLGAAARGNPPYLTIVGSPKAIPMARYDPHISTPRIYGDNVVYVDMQDGNLDVFVYGLSTGETSVLAATGRNEHQPAIWENTVAYTSAHITRTGTRDTDVRSRSLEFPHMPANSIAATASNEGQAAISSMPAAAGGGNTYAWVEGGRWGSVFGCDASLPAGTLGSCFPGMHRHMNIGLRSGSAPALSQANIAWADRRDRNDTHSNQNIYRGNIRSGATWQVTNNSAAQENPQIHRDIIVWSGMDSGPWDIYMCNISLDGRAGGCISTDSKVKLTSSGQNRYPSIWENTVAWTKYENNGLDFSIVAMDIGTREARTIYRSSSGLKAVASPWVQGGRVVFSAPEMTDSGIRRSIKVYDLGLNRYIASIPTLVSGGECNAERTWLELDASHYGRILGSPVQNVAVGRISGITPSDTSSYMNRVLFFDALPKERNALVIIREHWGDGISGKQGKNGTIIGPYAREHFWTPSVESEFESVFFVAGHPETASALTQAHIQGNYDSTYFILYDDHGGTEEFSGAMDSSTIRSNNMWMHPSTVFSVACSTCDFQRADITNLLCAVHLRYGAMQFHGATGMGYWHAQFSPLLQGCFVEGKTIGESFMDAKNFDREHNLGRSYATWMEGAGEPVQVMWGDPTFRPKWWSD